MIKKLIESKDGATAIEYGLLSAIIGVALISGFGAFSNALNNQFNYLASIINY
jgi:pilus assembly protein Flp/PilA